MAPSINQCFYGILPSHIYKKIWLHHFIPKKNTFLVIKGNKITPVLQIRPQAEVIKICFLIETRKQISM